MSVVCAYQIESVDAVTSDEPRWAWCVLHSGERCWVTLESLLRHRPDCAGVTGASTRASDGSAPEPPRSETAMTVVDVAHPYPAEWEPMLERLGRIEAMLRGRGVDPADRSRHTLAVTSDEGQGPPHADDRPLALGAVDGDLDAMLRDLLDAGRDDDGLDLGDLC